MLTSKELSDHKRDSASITEYWQLKQLDKIKWLKENELIWVSDEHFYRMPVRFIKLDNAVVRVGLMQGGNVVLETIFWYDVIRKLTQEEILEEIDTLHKTETILIKRRIWLRESLTQ